MGRKLVKSGTLVPQGNSNQLKRLIYLSNLEQKNFFQNLRRIIQPAILAILGLRQKLYLLNFFLDLKFSGMVPHIIAYNVRKYSLA